MSEPLRLSFEVGCAPEYAFRVWTARISQWWPTSHSVSGDDDLDVILEPRVGGRLFERTAAGTEHDWGAVTAWDPPGRLVYQWHLRSDATEATEVEITFTGLDDSTTRVDITHRGWERLGARGPGRRDANRAGWGGVLPRYIDFIAAHNQENAS